ncbi:quinol:cytochrome c oxidoreductase quinone-binding subunit 2 [Granulicella pectinivorans]|jgi:hypothetical protein|uniref:Quinol:cytochrome c oxidoreductase quinone-binding subunit 2 n=2 Tax=Granulicella pectinivorans TaxID=474950 RepID=A0A1I6LFV9_9BACT|nr:quinol:cytochrome c oxidoreductase quinone-binding subunit 2 [Granulicella pectinivorans]
MPTVLNSPDLISGWRTKSVIVAVVAALLSLVFLLVPGGASHILRAYLMGFILSFGFAGGGLVLLMLQYVSGGKWGLLLRRPLEAMSRTFPLVFLMWIPLAIAVFTKHLYMWARYPTNEAAKQALDLGLIGKEQELTMIAKRAMFSPSAFMIQSLVVFAILLLFTYLLNKWSLERDADPAAGTEPSFDRWRTKFENLSGPGIFLYVVLMTDVILLWVMSLDVTWYSSMWGLKFLVGQGYGVFALSLITVISLSKVEPIKTLLRTTEQHDLGKLAFAFTMLNIYLTFAEFLIIWSGNVPDEIPWYLNRIHGGWWTICTLDFVCHWLIPFCLLLSRNLKRDKGRLKALAIFMILARFIDMFWIIEPNFKDAAGNLHLAGNFGILAYITVPVAVVAAWGAYYLHQLNSRPLVNVNDPHLEELLEAEHAH